MNTEFNWWLLIVGLVLGAALTWLVMADTTRRDVDITERERPVEALWIAGNLSAGGRPVDPARIEDVLRLHREYLSAPPPDEPSEPVAPPSPDAPGSDAPDPIR